MDDAPSDISRRRYLSLAGGATLAATGLASGSAAAQDAPITTRIVLPRVETFEGNYDGQFLLMTDTTDVQVRKEAFERCEFVNWSAETTTAYQAELIDRLANSNDPTTVETNVFVNADEAAPITPGTLFVVNRAIECPERYVGLEVESLGQVDPDAVEESDLEDSGGESGAIGPGFGALGALGALGVGALARAWRRDGGR